MDENLKSSRFLIAKASGVCYKCRAANEFVAIVAPPGHEVRSESDGKWEMVEDFSVLGWIKEINPEARNAVQEFSDGWRLGQSKTLGEPVYMNHCRACQRHQGDFFLHMEPGGAFFHDFENTAEIKIVGLTNVPLVANCGMASSGGRIVFPDDSDCDTPDRTL